MKNATIKFLLPNAFPISKKGFYNDVRAVTLWDSEAHLTHRALSLLNTFLRF